MKKKIFVTGSNGYIGLELTKSLINTNKYDIYCLIRREKNNQLSNILDKKKIIIGNLSNDKILKKLAEEADIIVHLAFNNNPDWHNKMPIRAINESLDFLINLNMRLVNSERKIHIIYTSTASVYGTNPNKGKLNELTLKNIFSLYDFSKSLVEDFLQYLTNSNKNITCTVYRLSNVFGYSDSESNQKNRGFFNKLLTSAYYSSKITLLNSGNYYRDFIHISDVCKCIEKGFTLRNGYSIYNLSSGNAIKVSNFFSILMKIKKIKILHEETSSNDIRVRDFKADVSKLKKTHNIQHFVKIQDFIKKIDK